MLVEAKLCAWITAGLALYKANPYLVDGVFYDAGQVGYPTGLASGQLVDTEKQWLVDEYAGGQLRWAGEVFPVLGNTATTLTLEGDPSGLEPGDLPYYQIVPPAALGLNQLLQTQRFTILSAFAQIPTELPAFSIRLERDSQGDTYLGDHLQTYMDNGVELDVRQQEVVGSYLVSIWAINREACLWMYAWLMSWLLNSLPQFATWGLFDVQVSGSDLDPATQFLAERVYARHLLLTMTRRERAFLTRSPVEYITDIRLRVLLTYARFVDTIPQPLP